MKQISRRSAAILTAAVCLLVCIGLAWFVLAFMGFKLVDEHVQEAQYLSVSETLTAHVTARNKSTAEVSFDYQGTTFVKTISVPHKVHVGDDIPIGVRNFQESTDIHGAEMTMVDCLYAAHDNLHFGDGVFFFLAFCGALLATPLLMAVLISVLLLRYVMLRSRGLCCTGIIKQRVVRDGVSDIKHEVPDSQTVTYTIVYPRDGAVCRTDITPHFIHRIYQKNELVNVVVCPHTQTMHHGVLLPAENINQKAFLQQNPALTAPDCLTNAVVCRKKSAWVFLLYAGMFTAGVLLSAMALYFLCRMHALGFSVMDYPTFRIGSIAGGLMLLISVCGTVFKLHRDVTTA